MIAGQNTLRTLHCRNSCGAVGSSEASSVKTDSNALTRILTNNNMPDDKLLYNIIRVSTINSLHVSSDIINSRVYTNGPQNH